MDEQNQDTSEFFPQENSTKEKIFKIFNKTKKIILVLLVLLIFLVTSFRFLISAPSNFPIDKIYTVEEGSSLTKASNDLRESNIIRNKNAFQFFSILFGDDKNIIAGDYFFDKKMNVIEIALRISKGYRNLNEIKITIPEGYSVKEMSETLSEKLPYFNKEEFMNMAKDKEGYLFPDTYFLYPKSKTSEIIKIFEDNFDKKIKSINDDLEKTDKNLKQIITMASIIEKEANKDGDREVVSGILWKRIKIGLPLQVDATFLYINGKGSSDLTVDDLKIDSLYNTYKYKGLPPGPICNPGIKSILAAIYPESSPYLYYLHDKDGNIHYAKTFAEHKKNKSLYLK
ncbi:MAG: endolytic transglycosylase MltG [Candidatus Paceibacterota bacterium]|jgi:UPF0755 protein